MTFLETPIEKLPKVGPRYLARLKDLGIKTVKDLIWHFPNRYEDFSQVIPISEAMSADHKTLVNIIGEVVDIEVRQLWRGRLRSITEAVIEDDTDSIKAVWFNQPYIADQLSLGTRVSLAGQVTINKGQHILSNPTYEKISYLTSDFQHPTSNFTHTGRLVPIYPETRGITSKYLRFLIKSLVPQIKALPDPLPRAALAKYELPTLAQALYSIHFPESDHEVDVARKRLAFDDLLLFQLRALLDRRHMGSLTAPQVSFNKDLITKFVSGLPFKLTDDQRRAAYEILQDIERPFPMNRLLNGDVGSGKTVVALIAAYQTMSEGFQVVFMAPTEILAKQHFQTITSLISNFQFPISKQSRKEFPIKVGLLTGSEVRQPRRQDVGEPTEASAWHQENRSMKIGLLTGSEARQFPVDITEEEKISKKLIQSKIAKGEINLVIGTHAVIQKDVKFKKLALVVIDEQHRFGIKQRMKLLKDISNGFVPHLLSMTATPIPRTLALTIYGDLDISLLKEKPKGRLEIITQVVSDKGHKAAHEFIKKEIQSGRQVFVICPRIDASKVEESDMNLKHRIPELKPAPKISQTKLLWQDVKAVTQEFERLSKEIFREFKVAMLHGKMKPDEKNKIMADFRDKKHHVLVSTSVIEVGVDIPNASVMMIRSADRFGLAQLHQFRGRVGRGEHQSYCLLFSESEHAGRRLKALEKTSSGFELAEIDLKLRGPGEFIGTKQSGIPDLAMTSLTDLDLIKKARSEAKLLLKEDPTLKKHPLLLSCLSQMQKMVHFE